MKNILIITLTLLLSPLIHAQPPAQPRPMTQPPAHPVGEYNITNYGAIGDGTTLNTKAIQNTVDSCAINGGGKIIIPPGKFVTGSVRLRSNINLYLEAGAVLIGSPDNKDYLHQKDFGISGPGAGSRTGILFAHDADHITIGGQGVIDGQGDLSMYMDSLQSGIDFDPKLTRQGADYRNQKFGREDGPVMWKGTYEERPGVVLIFSHCKNIRVEDVRIRQAPNWTMAFMNCEEVQVRGLTIDNDMAIPNSDGIDMYDSKNVVISDCIINSGDDAIAVISSNNITVDNCVLHSRSSGIRIGYNVFNQNNSGDLLFNNIRIYDSNRGIGIFQRQGGDMRNILFSNMIIQTRLHTGGWWGNGEPIHISAVPGLGSKKVGKIVNVRFSHIIATGQSGLLFYGSKESPLEDIVLDDVSLTIERGSLTDSYGGNFDLRPTNDISLAIFSHKIPAIFGNEVKGLEIRNFSINFEGQLPAWFTKGLECSGCTGVRISGGSNTIHPPRQHSP
jgi:parallel beta-helix repeat protein